MPCIVCKKDRWSILRIPLTVMTEAREHYFRENYFTNYEFDHICRFCSIHETVVGGFINTVGFTLDMLMRFWLVALGVMMSYGACVKFGAPPPVTQVAPVLGGLFVGGVLGAKVIRWFFFGIGGLAAVVAGVIFLMHSDTLQLLPDVMAMAEREQIKKGGKVKFAASEELKSAPGSETTTKPAYDPIQASHAKTLAKRRARIEGFLKGLEEIMPFETRLTDDQFREAMKLSGITLVVYLVMVVMGYWMLGGVIREEKAKARKKKQERWHAAGGR